MILHRYIRALILEQPEYFGNSFVEFKKRTLSGEDPIFVANELFNKIGEGSHRIVYEIPQNNDHVVKIVNTLVEKDPKDSMLDKRGFKEQEKISANQNEADLQMQQKYPDVFPRTFEVSPDYRWILAEKVVPVDMQTFFEYLNLDGEGQISNIAFQALIELILEHIKNKDNKDHWSHPFFESQGEDIKIVEISNYDNENSNYEDIEIADTVPFEIGDKEPKKDDIPSHVLQSPMARRVRKIVSSPHNLKIFQAMSNLNIPSREFRRDNVGLSTIGNKRLVMLDTSLWDDSDTV